MADVAQSNPLLPALVPGTLDCLLDRVGGHDAEHNGHPAFQRYVGDALAASLQTRS